MRAHKAGGPCHASSGCDRAAGQEAAKFSPNLRIRGSRDGGLPNTKCTHLPSYIVGSSTLARYCSRNEDALCQNSRSFFPSAPGAIASRSRLLVMNFRFRKSRATCCSAYSFTSTCGVFTPRVACRSLVILHCIGAQRQAQAHMERKVCLRSTRHHMQCLQR